MRNAFLPVAALALALAAPAGAQTAALSSAPTSMRVARADASNAMRPFRGTGRLENLDGSLRRLVEAQENYWNHHGTYAEDVADLGTKWRRLDDVRLEILFAGSRSWSARAVNPQVNGKSCVIFVGYPDEVPELPVTSGRRVPSQERTPACDTP